MRKSQLLIILALMIMLLAINLISEDVSKSYFGGLPWYGWLGVGLFLVIIGLGFAWLDAERARRLLAEPVAPKEEEPDQVSLISEEDLDRLDPNRPDYPHPVIFPERCIGCHACVEACPHDVLAIVNGIASPVARDQCMEDTACQVECPVNPKACIVVNTTKKIKPRPVPVRDPAFMTNVAGCYIIGDVSGTPLIKNAANEGADVIRHIAAELQNGAGPEAKAEVEVAIIGVGPAGLSAAIAAKQANLRYVGIEQDKVLATIDAYPRGKYVFFKPETMDSRGTIAVDGAGEQREKILETWIGAMKSSGVIVNEGESCKSVRKADDGDYFVVQTERGLEREKQAYSARRVVLALGNRGTPMKLKVPGEELKITREGRTEDKVRYKLTDPEGYKKCRIIVVGAGNSAIEAAVDLVARRDGNQIAFRSDNEINDITLVIRSDMKNDLKFLNKLQVYQCIDEGKVKAYFGTSIKEIREGEVVLMNARTGEEKLTLANDYIFAMIGGDRPTKFLESIGIKIG
ncbi:MAG TPA: NAD(P)-binding domain-containing protein [Pyrinomonadaceae bacterium]|nr:NAD(P)-binding domain-containing protein [Pyrinomonadaceae bacterium]